ncbi:MAG TPA: ROK family protein [Solirubrobacterales bacterium]|nr:ROK family protein [Solirubrobacterales bacterium]
MSASETIGVDLGGTKMLVGVLSGIEPVYEQREASKGQTEDELVELLIREIEEAREARPDVAAVGLGIPATIDHDRGLAVSAVNLPLKDLPIRDIVSERTGLPVYVDNDGNVAALAEYLYGAAKGMPHMVMLTVGTGIGGGLILGGEIYRGSTGAGAELGHVVIQADGPPCQGNCPNHGCVESLASGTALGREGRAAGESTADSALGKALAEGKEIDGRVVTEAAVAGDETARGVFELIGSRLGVACSSLANIFQPNAIVVGGGVIAAGDLLLEPARREIRERALDPMNQTPILEATLGNDAGMIGAAAMARTELAKASEPARDGG